MVYWREHEVYLLNDYQSNLKKGLFGKKSTLRLRQSMSASSTVYPCTETVNLADARKVRACASMEGHLPLGISLGSATVCSTV